MDTFAPTSAPSMGSDAQFDGRVVENKFGDGYRQTFADGLNPVAATVPFTWTSCTIAQATYMHNFLLAHVGQPFLYTLPRETTPRKWDCKSWKRGWPAGGYDSFAATFTERFDLG